MAILLKAAIGSPWLPVHTMQMRLGGRVLSSLPLMKELSGILMTPFFLAMSHTFSMERPNTATFLPHDTAASRIWLRRRTLDAKVETSSLPGVLRICSLIANATWRSEIEKPGTDELVESLINRVTPAWPMKAIF